MERSRTYNVNKYISSSTDDVGAIELFQMVSILKIYFASVGLTSFLLAYVIVK